MRILYIAPRPPYPPEERETVRPYHQIRFLALKHDVDLICFSGGGVDEWDARERLKKFCPRVQIVPIDTPPQDPSRVTNLLSRHPLVHRRYYRKDLYRRLQGIGQTGRYDLVFVYSAAMSLYLEAFPDTPRIVDLVDVGSRRWMEYSHLTRFPASAVHRSEASRLRSVEVLAAKRAQRTLLASEEEAETLRSMCPENSRILSLKTPVNPRAPLPGPWSAVPTILLNGHLDHFPNADAAVRFLTETFPRIRERIRTAQVVVAGRNPPARIRALAEKEGVRLAPPKADLRPLFREAWLAVAPHRIGRGVRNEILEAAAAGVPVVSTRMAAKGLDLIPGRDLVVADPEDLADTITALLSDPGKLDRLGQRIRRAVQNNYSHWSAGLEIETIVASAASETLVAR